MGCKGDVAVLNSKPVPNDTERFFLPSEIIVSKTDLKGRMTYVNRVFCSVAGYTEGELLGKPHNLIRHPDMPRGVFKLLWDRLEDGHEVFAYVKNMCKGGEFYWVLAHVTPTFGASGEIVGYHSNRRVPARESIAAVESVYRDLMALEAKYSNPKEAAAAGMQAILKLVKSAGFPSYDAFVFSIINSARRAA